jgi:biopolymer transport protein ExbD
VLRTKKSRKKKDFDGEFDITPMIDVVLLLLIFFMVSARMAPQSAPKLPKAKYGDMASMHDAVVLTVKSSGPDSSVVSTPDGKRFSTIPDEQSAEISEYIVGELQNTKKKYVLVQAESSVVTSEIVRIQSAIGSVLDADRPIMLAVEH